MLFNRLDEELANLNLTVGDVLIEVASGSVGFLIERVRRVDIVEDDIYFWEVAWVNKEAAEESLYSHILEEEHLKLSIFLGIIKWQSINGETFEL
jgi:DNA-binding GntR family transcriptional regulator